MSELTTTESQKLEQLENVIEQGLQTFVEVGNALMGIREDRLYRQEFDTFEEYCKTRWQLERRRAYQLMGAASVVENLSTMVDNGEDVKNFSHRESHVSPLANLEPEQQVEVWQEAVETAPDGKVTARTLMIQFPKSSNACRLYHSLQMQFKSR